MELMSQSERFNHGSELIERLTTEDLHILRKAPVIQELVQFLQSVRSERETVEAV
jgi:predicted nucleic acid-binding protein